jgi:hypothetical protein
MKTFNKEKHYTLMAGLPKTNPLPLSPDYNLQKPLSSGIRAAPLLRAKSPRRYGGGFGGF